MRVLVKLNPEHNGVELRFVDAVNAPCKVPDDIKARTRRAGYKYSYAQRMFYAAQTPAALTVALDLGGAEMPRQLAQEIIGKLVQPSTTEQLASMLAVAMEDIPKGALLRVTGGTAARHRLPSDGEVLNRIQREPLPAKLLRDVCGSCGQKMVCDGTES